MTEKKARPSQREIGTVVYCGPTIPGVANQFTFYQNGLPTQLEQRAEETPEIRGLLVPLAEFPETMKKLQGGFGNIYRLYRLVQAKL